ncbi:signal transduction histidine kinase/ligand-binding sensor domain-containing protein [Luteibacter jiangsuensis]|uniref:Signal transduction histidine kinase/ligand-binding sensor domain-containing protein n=1 Tax=Luteibacter jiangsuensis TaxID=637577 RepID=A0ABT9STX5_9GAMM|nr:sensor histidine kinase [Luteibacter jiangsuensis]MDQ0008450.1 signal transduction histidine kinase/ligand-binding sensor domain-containing protein [Luteibacter jiangsuensis]
MILRPLNARHLMLLLASLLAWLPAAHATDPARTLGQLHHIALRAEEGAPASIVSMAQTEDGWLWLSTRMGLFRYDGFVFEKIPLQPPSSNESEATWTIYAAPGGDLWVAGANGGVARVRDGKATLYGAADGLPDHVAINDFATDGDGGLWATTEVGIYRLDGSRWKEVSSEWGIPREVDMFLEDARGNLWAGTDRNLYVLRKGTHRFEDTGIRSGSASHLMVHPDGSLWQRTGAGFHPLPGEWGKPFPHPHPRRANSTTTAFDRDGNLWTVACAVNLCRMAAKDVGNTTTGDVGEPAMQTFSEDLGMTSQATMTLMEDRDGHVWVSTKMGLDTFRDTWLSRIRFPKPEVYFSVVEDGHGQVWTGTAARTVYPDTLWKLTPDPVALPGFEGTINSAYRDTDGSLWLGGSGKLWHMRDGKPAEVDLPDDAATRGITVQAIARDGDGRLWVSLRLRGVYLRHADGWLPASSIAPFPTLAPAVIHVDPAGKAWFGYLDGTVAMLDGNTLRRFDAGSGLEQGPVTAIATIGDRLVVGSEHGLSFFDGDRFQRLAAQPADRFNSITGIVQSKEGCVWAYGIAGVIRFTPQAWKAALGQPKVPTDVQVLTMEDGAPGPAQLVRPLPTVVATGGGRLWFAGSQGLAWLDSSVPPSLPLPPPVVIKSIVSGASTFHPGDTVRLHDTRDLGVTYTALAPGRPRGLTFRYKLEGVDGFVQDAGNRHEALYTDLPPGQYSFWAEASYDGSRWSRSTPVTVTVTPRLVERTPFKVFCLMVAAGLVWLAHRWRVRLLTQRLRLRLDERHGERERIARELHDTLLQGVQGLILKFQAFVDGLAKEDAARATLERTIDRAEALLVEGRDRVKGLRSHASEEGSLEDRIASLVDDVGIPVYFAVQYGNRRRPVNPVVIDELHSIVREAVINAMQHSHAHSIRITVEHARRSLKVWVSDDGDGFTTVPDAREGNGHFGLVGMRERAQRMGGKLKVQSAPQRGTLVTVRIPARVAYAGNGRKALT